MENLTQDNKQEEANLEKIIGMIKNLSKKFDKNNRDLDEFIGLIEESQNINVKNNKGISLLTYLIKESFGQKKYLDLAKEILSRRDTSINDLEDCCYNSYKAANHKLSDCSKSKGLKIVAPNYLGIIKLMEAHPNFVDDSLKSKIKAFKDHIIAVIG